MEKIIIIAKIIIRVKKLLMNFFQVNSVFKINIVDYVISHKIVANNLILFQDIVRLPIKALFNLKI